ncbi:MAG: 30S ribosomal protein S3ae [Thermoplasmata archaeon]|nr:30S ribosomal protein S3ae [Euryarchaeota archaeon]RLF63465.1 MAG: 30S ribosomal protein S3ae [Thermoplasmata archaeon]
MASRSQARKLAKSARDKWRAKEWYKIIAPDYFNRVVLGETPADDPSKVIGRVAEVTVADIGGPIRRSYIKLYFKVYRVHGLEAHSRFIGHEMTQESVQKMVKRKRSRIDGVFDVRTKDGYLVRVKPIIITMARVNTSRKDKIRKIAKEVVEEIASQTRFEDFVHMLIDGRLAEEIKKRAKVVYPIRECEIRKSEVLLEPTPEERQAVVQTEEAPKAEQEV